MPICKPWNSGWYCRLPLTPILSRWPFVPEHLERGGCVGFSRGHHGRWCISPPSLHAFDTHKAKQFFPHAPISRRDLLADSGHLLAFHARSDARSVGLALLPARVTWPSSPHHESLIFGRDTLALSAVCI